MKITDKKEAEKYFEEYVKWQMSTGQSREKAEGIVKANLGYYAGYYSDEVRKRVEKLFNCAHPIFGSIKENGITSNEEALECGKQNKTLSEIRS